MMHHRRSLTAILSVTALAFAALAFAAPAMASPQRAPAASVNLCQAYALDVAEIVDDNGVGYLLDNPGHNNIVRTFNNQYVTYSFMNCQRWTDKFQGNQAVYVTEFGFPDLHLCIDAATNGDMYLESCIKGDANELFYVTDNGGPGPYIISVGQSELWDQSMYMTALSLSNNALVYAAGGGNGTRAQWRFGLVSLRPAG